MKAVLARSRGRRRHAAALLAAACCAFLSPDALGNGRFPRAERLIEDPNDPRSLLLAATYGLVTTSDRGSTWYHVCEAAFAGAEGYVGDPVADVTPAGSLVVDVQTQLNLSRDRGCSWTTTLGSPTENLADFAISRRAPTGLLALRSALEDGGTVRVYLMESLDDGATFTTLGGGPLPLFAAFTVDVAPSTPATIYVSGRSANGTNELLVSTDHGATWNSNDIQTNPLYEETPYIAAVDPSDPQKVFVRTDAWDTSAGTQVAADALLYTDDGGKTWKELYRAGAKLLGFALSPDSSNVLIGYGDPRDPEWQVDDSVNGVYASATSSFAFTRVMTGSITCLTWTTGGVYVCTDPRERGYSVGFLPGGAFVMDASNVEVLLNLATITGPLCCGGAPSSTCAPAWPNNCAVFGACGDAGGVPPTSCSVTAGDAASSGEGEAAAPAKGDGFVEAGPGEDAGVQNPSGGACACRAGESSRRDPAAIVGALAAAAIVGTRIVRRRRRSKISSA